MWIDGPVHIWNGATGRFLERRRVVMLHPQGHWELPCRGKRGKQPHERPYKLDPFKEIDVEAVIRHCTTCWGYGEYAALEVAILAEKVAQQVLERYWRPRKWRVQYPTMSAAERTSTKPTRKKKVSRRRK